MDLTDGGDEGSVARSVPEPDPDDLAAPRAGMVLHRVLAAAARTFLLNDPADDPELDRDGAGPVPGNGTVPGAGPDRRPPVWARSAPGVLDGGGRQDTEEERVHQTRVAMRRIRSNLRTYRLLCDPAWGTALRAEAAWYGDLLGQVRDLQILHARVAGLAGDLLGTELADAVVAELERGLAAARADVAASRDGTRRRDLAGQMTVLWEGPTFKPKAARPARDVLPPMLERTWRDFRGAAAKARKDPTPAHLHKVRIRVKDLRYGSETLALLYGGPARKTARAAQRLQTRLGDVHDADVALGWLAGVADRRPELSGAAAVLADAVRTQRAELRSGWKKDVKEIDRRWRAWHR